MATGLSNVRTGELRVGGPLARRHNVNLVGSGDQIVVFGHGLGTDQSAWLDIATRLPDRYMSLLFDLPGAGPSLPTDFKTDDYQSLAPFADDLLNLLDETGARNCVYVGHSVSGMIGVLAAIEQPSLFSKLVLLNASPRYLNDDDYVGGFDQSDLEALFTAMASNYQSWVAGFAPLAVGAAVPAAVNEFSAGLMAMRPDVTLRIARTIFESDVRELLPRLRVPTVFIHSKADIAVPAEVGRYLHQNVSGSDLVWIDAQGHLPHLSAPEAVSKALRSALAR